MLPVETIRAFDRYLRDRELGLQAVIVGGAALGLLGLTERQTRDVDVLIPDLSTGMLDAPRSFARQQRKAGFHPKGYDLTIVARQAGIGYTDTQQIGYEETNPCYPEKPSPHSTSIY